MGLAHQAHQFQDKTTILDYKSASSIHRELNFVNTASARYILPRLISVSINRYCNRSARVLSVDTSQTISFMFDSAE